MFFSRSGCCRRTQVWALAVKDLPLDVDGRFGRKTILALQYVLADAGYQSGPFNGRLDCRTMTALKEYLQASGYEVGPCCKTTRALQAWARDQGANPGPIDGWWGPRTTRAIQIALNAVRAKANKAPGDSHMKAMETAFGVPLDVKKNSASVNSIHIESGSMDPAAIAFGVPLLSGVASPA